VGCVNEPLASTGFKSYKQMCLNQYLIIEGTQRSIKNVELWKMFILVQYIIPLRLKFKAQGNPKATSI